MFRIPLSVLLVSAVLAAAPFAATAQATAEPSETTESLAELEILPAEQVDLASYLWTKRVLVVFADTPADPRFVKQMQMIGERSSDLIEHDVVVVTDSAPDPRSDIRKELRPRGFALVLVDKDGGIKLRKPSPWSTREIARSIDKTPLRRQEIQERHGLIGQ